MTKIKFAIELLLVGLCLTVMIGCTNHNKENTTLSSKEEKLLWQGKRTKPFGVYDYKKISSKEEAIKVLNDKFQLALSSFYDISNKRLSETNFFENYEQEKTTYNITAKEDTLLFEQSTYYGSSTIPELVRSVIQITYKVNTESKVVKTTNQQVTITTVASESPKFYASLADISKQMASDISFTKVDETVKQAFSNYPDEDEQRKMESVSIFPQSESDASLMKNIKLFYNASGKVTEWNTTIVSE